MSNATTFTAAPRSRQRRVASRRETIASLRRPSCIGKSQKSPLSRSARAFASPLDARNASIRVCSVYGTSSARIVAVVLAVWQTEAAAGAKEELGGGLREQVAGGAGGAQGSFDHGDEGGALAAGLELTGCDDSHGEGGVVLHLKATMEGGEADEPEGEEVAAIEVVVEEGGEFLQEIVGEKVGLVEDEDGLEVLLVDEVQQGAFEVLPELTTAMVRA